MRSYHFRVKENSELESIFFLLTPLLSEPGIRYPQTAGIVDYYIIVVLNSYCFLRLLEYDESDWLGHNVVEES
jgi:hypothetical protein